MYILKKTTPFDITEEEKSETKLTTTVLIAVILAFVNKIQTHRRLKRVLGGGGGGGGGNKQTTTAFSWQTFFQSNRLVGK